MGLDMRALRERFRKVERLRRAARMHYARAHRGGISPVVREDAGADLPGECHDSQQVAA